MYQHKHNGSSKGEENEKWAEKIHEEIMAKNLQIQWRTFIYICKKFKKILHRVK